MAPVNGSSRKRRRIPPSCLSCRKRKTKCDRQRPFCGRCATDGIKSDCVYEATSEVLKKSEGQRLKIDSLKSKIKLLEETIELKNSIIESYSDGNGPAAKIRGTLGHLINPKDPPTFNSNLPILAKENQDFDGFVMINSFLVYQGPTSFIANFQRDENTKAVFDELNKHLHENTMPDKAVFKLSACDVRESPMSDRTAQLAAEIGKLPALKHVELLIEHFFNTCYPLVSFIDKESMVPKLYSLIQDKGDYCIISHSKRKQRVEIAILLIILRFGFISLPSKGRVSNLKISTYYIECASRLLISLVTLKIVTFTTVQGFLLLLVYRMHCPEDDDSLHDVAMLQSMIIQSAREIGLDRNPKSYPSQFLDSKTMYFWRNAWIHICYFNTSRTFEQGQCPSTNISASDTSFILSNNLKFQQSPGVFRNLEYMESVSQSVGDVMLNLVDKRIVDERSICQLLKYLNSILENDTRTFRQLRTQDKYILVEGGLSERVREFILRLDLSFKSYSLYYFLYLNLSDDNEFQTKEKNQYLALAIEKALILLKVNHEFSKDPSAMFGTEYENIIASRIWRNSKMVLSCVISLIVRIHEGKCSLSDAFGYFDSPDSSGLIRWAGIRYDDEKQTMLNIAHVLEELYTNGMSSCTKFYSCFKSCLFIWYGVHYLQVKFPEIFAPVAAHNWSLENYFADLCPLDEVGEFWDDQHGLNSAPDVDLFFSKLGIDFDDLSKNMDNG